MTYIMLMLLIGGLLAIGIANYRLARSTARKLRDLYDHGESAIQG